MISFIIPAHNEEAHLEATLQSVHEAARAVGEPYEVIVVDDASTDRTGRIAEERGARVVRVAHRQISATRNAGAREARGDVFFFVDADTLANGAAVSAALAELRRGAVAGGCVFQFDGALPRWVRWIYPSAVALMRRIKLVGGCFLFCRRETFEAVGGFPEALFAGEEIVFIKAVKRQGKFAVPEPTVVTSGRKVRAHSGRQLFMGLWSALLHRFLTSRERKGLEVWYGERPVDDVSDTITVGN